MFFLGMIVGGVVALFAYCCSVVAGREDEAVEMQITTGNLHVFHGSVYMPVSEIERHEGIEDRIKERLVRDVANEMYRQGVIQIKAEDKKGTPHNPSEIKTRWYRAEGTGVIRRPLEQETGREVK